MISSLVTVLRPRCNELRALQQRVEPLRSAHVIDRCNHIMYAAVWNRTDLLRYKCEVIKGLKAVVHIMFR